MYLTNPDAGANELPLSVAFWPCIQHQRSGRTEAGDNGGVSVIELDRVAYSYGGSELFGDVSLTLSPGTFHFLTGPSGSGKTTLLKLCYGDLFAPPAGRSACSAQAGGGHVAATRSRCRAAGSAWCIRTASFSTI